MPRFFKRCRLEYGKQREARDARKSALGAGEHLAEVSSDQMELLEKTVKMPFCQPAGEKLDGSS